MEIKFNPGRLSEPGTSQPVTQRDLTPSADVTLPHERVQSLEQSLRDAAQVRPEVVEKARKLVSDSDYPPDVVLNGVASLLAKNMQQ